MPFPDVVTPPHRASPSAFLSYSHDSPKHKDRVLNLAQRLRAEGVDCELDLFIVSPPEGWPAWTRHQLERQHFCIVVCTETYVRRFSGDEVPGVGKGATWEGWMIRTMLYESGRNDRVIPVVFDEADVSHIPLELQSATRYNAATPDGYDQLYRTLTRQPLVVRPPLGTVRVRPPRLDPDESTVADLLHLCPEPLPLDVIASAAHTDLPETTATLDRLARYRVAAVTDGLAHIENRSRTDTPVLPARVSCSALRASLDFIRQHRRESSARAQLQNVVTLSLAADDDEAAEQISRTFRVIQSLLKSHGDKHLILDVARRSIAASKAPGRSRTQVEDHAVALVCGVSWVYQRTARLPEALVEARRSLQLGLDIGWDENTAFCKKCMGRLERMRAEETRDREQRATLLGESVDLLRDAIARFTALKQEPEVGDCYSLLARTYLVADQRVNAGRAVAEAEERLVEPASKDYLDLQIVQGDLAAYTDAERADILYTDAIANAVENDAQKSEIVARAYLRRGKLRARLGSGSRALNDLRQAVALWEALGDPAADAARWEEIELTADWLNHEVRDTLASVPIAVRVRVAREIVAGGAVRTARSRRAELPDTYLRGLIAEAKARLAEERTDW
ncbi:MAG: TIR domain-containing protein [Gammaproteobacteria bacterium]|nr:TIR domain-containing protein [Gammaproteobacteria bacterium]